MYRYSFRPVLWEDRPALIAWQAQEHVHQWWEEVSPFDEDDFLDPRVSRWIVSCEGTEFAYMQDYDPHGWKGHPFSHLPPGSRGIDQYIGDPTMVGQGHGPRFIKARIAMLFEQGAPVVATDPHPDNANAVSAYRKAGFQDAGPPVNSPWGRILPMTILRSS